MIQYLIQSFKRKIARRITKKYPTHIDRFPVDGYGIIQFANWENPLVKPKEISLGSVLFFKKFLREGDCAVDIGANIGHMTVSLALAVGKKGITFAFDPNPFVYDILLQNSKLNPESTTIHAFNCAIAEKEEEYYYSSSEASFNNGGISKVKDGKHGKYVLDSKIPGIRLEEFISKTYPDSLSKIRLIKIDTEGYDKEIIKSISGVLHACRPVVISECFRKNNMAERYEHFELLKSIGYSLYYFSDFNVNASILPIEKKEDMLRWEHFDFYAVME